MTPLPDSQSALMDERVREAFRRLPLLEAFSFDQQLEIADIELHAWPGSPWGEDVYGEIGDEMSALLADLEEAQAVDLLRGRTFARALH
jgi:hypothetical protein